MADTPKNGVQSNGDGKAILMERIEGETEGQTTARGLLDPCTRHAFTSMPFIGTMLHKSVPMPGPMDFVDGLKLIAGKAEAGDLGFVSRMLASQSVALDTIFGEFTRRSALNMGGHLDAAERYARLALKAQANSRSTLETLARLHQPREQIVRHVHVNDGGQAIVADQVNHYTEGGQNAETLKQSHAAGAIGQCSEVPCPDPAGRSMPIPSGEKPEAMPDARGHKSRRA
jgi:hypothetical protein